jgi:hypothetical protein
MVVINSPASLATETASLHQFYEQRCRPIFFSQFFLEGSHTGEEDIKAKGIGRRQRS